MAQTFHRDRSTWLLYLLLAFYGYFLNILGPITPFLKDELALSYTVSSLHFTAFAVGILLVGLVGLFVIGLGVAGLYPLLLSQAIGVAGNDTVRASARTTLASGAAIFALPLVLGRLADMVGIRPAYGVVGVLLIGIFLIMLVTGSKKSRQSHP